MNFFLFTVFAQEETNKIMPKSLWESIPMIPLVLLLLFLLAGAIFYIIKKRKKDKTNFASNLINPDVTKETLPNIAVTLSPKPPEKSHVQNMGLNLLNLASIFSKENLAKKYSFSNPTKNLLNPKKPSFYKTTKFLAGLFIILLVTIPILIYLGVKQQQSITGKGQECSGGCGPTACCRNWETMGEDGCCHAKPGEGCLKNSDCQEGYICNSEKKCVFSGSSGSCSDKCCSGSPDCGDINKYQCVRKEGTCCDSGSVCVEIQGNLPGCCATDADCAAWETCEASPEASGCSVGGIVGRSCRSKAGCTKDTDCVSGKCQGGTCVGTGTLECHADNNGVRITNNTGFDKSGTVSWFSNWCSDNGGTVCGCVGTETEEQITVKNGETWSRGIRGVGPPVNCAWQSDIKFDICHNANSGCVEGCGSQPSPTPTTPLVEGVCRDIRVYDLNGNLIQINSVNPGQTYRFTTAGTSDGFTRARFRFNGGAWKPSSEGTSELFNGEFFVDYPIPAEATTFKVEAMVYHPSLGWK